MPKCTCTGPLCTCNANGVVKDGFGVLVSATLVDAANDNGDWPRSVYDCAGVGYDHTAQPTPVLTADAAPNMKQQEEDAQRCRDGVAMWDKAVAAFNAERRGA